MEQWMEIKNYPKYLISDEGRVINRQTEIILKQKFNRGDYLIVNLYNQYNMKTKTVHRLVAEAFLDSDLKELQVNHKDGDKTNNAVWNLEFLSCLDNHHHAFRMNLRNQRFRPQAVRCLETNECFSSMAEAGKRLGVSPGNISAIIRGRARSINGYHFELID